MSRSFDGKTIKAEVEDSEEGELRGEGGGRPSRSRSRERVPKRRVLYANDVSSISRSPPRKRRRRRKERKSSKPSSSRRGVGTKPEEPKDCGCRLALLYELLAVLESLKVYQAKHQSLLSIVTKKIRALTGGFPGDRPPRGDGKRKAGAL